jgi:hypothetical protein
MGGNNLHTRAAFARMNEKVKAMFRTVSLNPVTAALAMLAIAVPGSIGFAQEARVSGSLPVARSSYADLADLADHAGIVAVAQVRKVSRLKPEQAPNVRPGWARVYVEARTTSLLYGGGLGESLKYLADVKLDAKGGLPKLKKASVVLFANPVAGRPGELRLVAPDAQILADPATLAQVRTLLGELYGANAAPRVTGIREAIHVPGNLAGEGETQVFMATERGDPVSLTIVRRPGMAPVWGVSLSEIVDQAAKPPPRDTLTWYRLACFLPPELPREAILSGSAEDRRTAAEDYRMVMRDLGPCGRTRG